MVAGLASLTGKLVKAATEVISKTESHEMSLCVVFDVDTHSQGLGGEGDYVWETDVSDQGRGINLERFGSPQPWGAVELPGCQGAEPTLPQRSPGGGERVRNKRGCGYATQGAQTCVSGWYGKPGSFQAGCQIWGFKVSRCWQTMRQPPAEATAEGPGRGVSFQAPARGGSASLT